MEGMPETYYEILGVSSDASDREIKHAYRILARKLHPDICRETGAEERFKRINEAYRVLSNLEERSRYDAMGHEKFRRTQVGSRDFSGPHGPADLRGSGDLFDLFFSEKAWGSARTFSPRSVSDILVRIEITLEEAILGSEKVIEVPYATRCTSCGGTGSTTRKVSPCPRCGASGREGGMASWGFIDPGSSPCRECGGKGRVPEAPCILCGGWGATQLTRRVTVRIPPGIDSGMRIRREGLGEERDHEIPNGDLYVEVVILPHDRFTRRGDDLEIPVHISPARAALGTIVEVETVDGKVLRVEIPQGVQHDAAVRVEGEGVKMGERCGNLLARIKIDTPVTLTSGERHLYQHLVRIEEGREEKRSKGIITRYFSRMRDAGR